VKEAVSLLGIRGMGRRRNIDCFLRAEQLRLNAEFLETRPKRSQRLAICDTLLETGRLE